MPRGFFIVLLCSFILVGHLYSQEVIVAREAKPEASKQAPPPEQGAPASERTDVESETSTEAKSQVRKKKSPSAALTVEQMRMAGALAAERLNNPSPSQARRSGQSDSEAASTPNPAVPETPRPVKRETHSEQTNPSHRPSSRTAKPDASGVVRPTFMESGREQPSTTPLPKGQTPAP